MSITFAEEQWQAKADDARGKELIVRRMCSFFPQESATRKMPSWAVTSESKKQAHPVCAKGE